MASRFDMNASVLEISVDFIAFFLVGAVGMDSKTFFRKTKIKIRNTFGNCPHLPQNPFQRQKMTQSDLRECAYDTNASVLEISADCIAFFLSGAVGMDSKTIFRETKILIKNTFGNCPHLPQNPLSKAKDDAK